MVRALLSSQSSLRGDLGTYWLENGFIGLVIDPISEGVVNSIVLAFASPDILIKRNIKIKWIDK